MANKRVKKQQGSSNSNSVAFLDEYFYDSHRLSQSLY